MKMKIVYIAHPVGGDVAANLQKIKAIVRAINLATEGVVPFAPYWLDCHALVDDVPKERKRGIRNNTALFKKGFIDELWLYGGRVSKGMQKEIDLAKQYRIPVIDKANCLPNG